MSWMLIYVVHNTRSDELNWSPNNTSLTMNKKNSDFSYENNVVILIAPHLISMLNDVIHWTYRISPQIISDKSRQRTKKKQRKLFAMSHTGQICPIRLIRLSFQYWAKEEKKKSISSLTLTALYYSIVSLILMAEWIEQNCKVSDNERVVYELKRDREWE